MKIDSYAISNYREISKITPEQRNTIADKVSDKKAETKENLNDVKNQKNELKADIYTYKTKQNQIDIYTEVASEKNETKNVDRDIDININIERDRENRNAGLVDKNPYNKINEYV